MDLALEVLLPPFVACLVLMGIHVYLGLHVVSRGVIFVDLALAQIAGLGATFAFLLGYEPSGMAGYVYSLIFAFIAAAVFSGLRLSEQRIPKEAIIGISFAVASATTILIADRAPQGAEFVEAMLTGALLWAPWSLIGKTAVAYVLIGLFHWHYRKRFLALSLEPERAETEGWSVRWWDFLFYISFGLVITYSVPMAGILLVFSFLIIPTVIAMLFARSIIGRLVVGWMVGTLVSMVGLTLSFAYDLPSGPAVVCIFGCALVLAGIIHYLVGAEQKIAAFVRVGAGSAAVAGGLWLAFTTSAISSGEDHVDPTSEVVSGQPVDAVTVAAESLAAIESSTGTPPAEAITRLMSVKEDVHRMMGTGELKVSEGAVQALARVDSGEVGELLEEIAYHADDPWARLRAGEALLARGNPLGVEALINLLEADAPAFLQMQASEALQRATAQPISFDPQADSAAKAAAITAWRAWWQAHRGEPLPQPGS
ncbi:MAG: iron chelate uptake ABC transporter family permease subunit [Vicinamibacteria bacterium]